VPSGTLILIGGGGMPKGLMERFVELAGGPAAEIVYLPCTEVEEVPREARFIESIRRLGVKQATLVHTKDRAKANRDQEFLAPLKTATGVFFGGGRQWNLVDSYQNTTAHKLIHDVLARGGVIAGSSAGASIQGDYMPRGDPLGNLNIIAEGYERGLGLLCGVAIDQHFTQRKRHADMTLLMKTYPQLLGIGLDESTALVVQKSAAEVVGANHVHFYDYQHPPADSDKDYVALTAGQVFDLKARKIVDLQP
jgi:cyanophycinase